MRKHTFAFALIACSVLTMSFMAPAARMASPSYSIRLVSPFDPAAPRRGIQAPAFINPSGYTGNRTLIVILIQFTDVTANPARTSAHYHDLLFNTSNPGSLTNYFLETSYGRLNLSGQVTPWLNSSKTKAYYGADSGAFPNIDDLNGDIFELAREAVQLADPHVNFSQYDNDGNGFIDNLVVIHAGEGQESSGVANDIWSHRWAIQPAELVDGKLASDYAMLAEDSPVGVFAHEFGHLLDLPDLYDYTYSGVVFAGDWAVMDSGSWNGPLSAPGSSPSHPLAWSKLQLGFVNKTNSSETMIVGLNEQAIVTIMPTHNATLPEDHHRVAIVNVTNPGGPHHIYYTIEVRDNSADSFDEWLPDSGVLISFCNDSATNDVFYGLPGAAVVMNAQPSIPSKKNATFDLGPGENPKFVDDGRNVVIELLSKNETTGAYTISISQVQVDLCWYYVNGSDHWQALPGNDYNLTVELSNVGTHDLTSVSAVLSTADAHVTVNDDTVSYGTIQPGVRTNGTSVFNITVGPAANSTPVDFTLEVAFNSTMSTNLSLQLPVQLETNTPYLVLESPLNGSKFNASDGIVILAQASDPVESHSGIFKAWFKTTNLETNVTSKWKEMVFNTTHVAGELQISKIGNYSVIVRLMDNSGNINETSASIEIIDEIPPTILLSVNGPQGNPSRISILGTQLMVVAVVLDNGEVATVDLSLNGGTPFSIFNSTTDVLITGGGGEGIAYGTYTGYYYNWTPSVEGAQRIVIYASDEAGNVASAQWEVLVLSEMTIYIIIGAAVVFIFLMAMGAYAYNKRREAKKRQKKIIVVG